MIVAGGEANRFPGKLEYDIAGTPLLLRVYGNLRGEYPICVSARASFSPQIDAALECPMVIDRGTRRGPFGGLTAACEYLRAERIFAVAGDAPSITLDVLRVLAAAWRPGDEVVVPEHDGRLEPLAALYDRAAFLRASRAAVERGSYALHAVLDAMAVRRVALPSALFLNVNTLADLPATIPEDSKGIA